MLEALEFLHSKDVMVVHRDITPQNILYTKLDNFVLAGFSLARFGIPETAMYGGTLRYLAPEVYEASEETTASDIWSLGVLSLDILWLVHPVHEEPGFDWNKEKARFANLCQIAKEVKRPELAMMVKMKAHERSTAAEVLRFMKASPSAQVQRYQPSVELLLLLQRQTSQNAGTSSSTSTSTTTRRTGEMHPGSLPVGSARGTEGRAGPSSADVPVRPTRALTDEEQMRLQLPPEIQRILKEGLAGEEWKELVGLLAKNFQPAPATADNDPSHPSNLEDQTSSRHAEAYSPRKVRRTTQASVLPDVPPPRPAGPSNLRGESQVARNPPQALPRHEAQDRPKQGRAKESASEPSRSTAASSPQGKNPPEQALPKPTRHPQAGSQSGTVKAEKPRSSSDSQKSTRQQEEAKGKASSSSPSSGSGKKTPGAKSRARR